MLPLSGSEFPTTAENLQKALAAGFAEHGLVAKAVAVHAPAWPRIDALSIDLTGASATRDLRAPGALTAAGEELTVGALDLLGAPLLLEGRAVDFRLEARDAVFVESTGPGGEKALALRRSGPGKLAIAMGKDALQALALTVGREAAKAHGADLQELHFDLQAEGQRAVRFEAKVTAKMGFLKANLTLTGRAELDSALLLHLSNLDLKGQGMGSTVAAGFIRPQLEKVQRTPLSLAFVALGDVTLQDVRLSTGETIRVEAEFSSGVRRFQDGHGACQQALFLRK